MPKFALSFTNGFNLIYNLDTSFRLLNEWMQEIVKYEQSDLCKINYKMSTGHKKIVQEKIKLLYEIADILNEAYPNSIVKEEFFEGNEEEILNRMHVHFPIIHYGTSLKDITYYAAQYNSLIHSLEDEFKPYAFRNFRLAIDIHKSPKGFNKFELDERDYEKFSVFHEFGSLILGYPHVGKHALELYKTQDLICPKDQYTPQTHITASCAFVFKYPPLTKDAVKQRYFEGWTKFYYDRGGKEFFGYDIDDPGLRLGTIKIGHLCYAEVNNIELNLKDSIKIRNLALTNDIISFTIIE